jgi:hypothetical protein
MTGHGLLRFAQDDMMTHQWTPVLLYRRTPVLLYRPVVSMFSIMASPNSDVLSSVAPGISRSKS